MKVGSFGSPCGPPSLILRILSDVFPVCCPASNLNGSATVVRSVPGLYREAADLGWPDERCEVALRRFRD